MDATAFLLNGNHLDYLIKILNSKISHWIFKKYYAGGGLGESGVRYKKAFLENLPIPDFNDNTRIILETTDDQLIDKTIIDYYKLTDEEKAFISAD